MTSQTEFPRFGIDVSKRWLDIAEYGRSPVLHIDNTAPAIRSWLRTLPPGACHIACESTGTYHRALVKLLIGAGHRVYLIDGYTLSRYRDTLGQRAKTDRHDAGLIARYLAHEGARLRPFSLPPRAVSRGCALPLFPSTQPRSAVTSISIFMRGSASPAEIIIAAGRTSPKYLRSTGQQASNSAPFGST